MGLWENVFHDSKEYISLIFDNYFNEDYIEYHENEGKIVSALLGVPYEFGSGNYRLRGLYLCGLATSETFRQKGLMSELLEKINNKCQDRFDFTFLIPASDLMADYYHRHGYFNSFFRVEERYTCVHDFKNDFFVSLSDTDERIRDLKLKLYDEIKVEPYSPDFPIEEKSLIKFIQELEHNASGNIVNLLHSEKDIKIILKENEISGNSVFVAYDKDSKICGVAFVVKEEMKRIKIPMIYVGDNSSYYALLNHIKKVFEEYSVSVYKNAPTADVISMMEQSYAASNPDGGDLESLFGLIERPFSFWQNMRPYGMVKLLNFYNILRFLAETKRETSFKLLIKDWPENCENDSTRKLIIVNKGKMELKDYIEGQKDSNILKLTSKELSELLCRKRDANNLIMEAFGIPRLVLKMAMMLD